MPRITKVKALAQLMEDNGGAASWKHIYDNIEKHYPNIKAPKDWQAALRGVLYRELKDKMSIQTRQLTITIEEEYIKDVLEFAQINLDVLDETDFLNYREAVYALREATTKCSVPSAKGE